MAWTQAMRTRRLCVLPLLAVLCVESFRLAAATLSSSVEGTVAVPGPPVQPFSFSNCKIVLTADSGLKLTAHVRPDGTFRFPAVPAATYLMDVHAMGYIFPQFRVDVSSKRRDQVAVSLLSTNQLLEQPLLILPLGAAKYFQPRKPLDLRAYLMSPYGMMIGFAVLTLVVLPMMKVDPEEMKKMQEEMKSTPLAGFLGGAGGSSASSPSPSTSAAGPSKKRR